jgi:hypothetical protein
MGLFPETDNLITQVRNLRTYQWLGSQTAAMEPTHRDAVITGSMIWFVDEYP